MSRTVPRRSPIVFTRQTWVLAIKHQRALPRVALPPLNRWQPPLRRPNLPKRIRKVPRMTASPARRRWTKSASVKSALVGECPKYTCHPPVGRCLPLCSKEALLFHGGVKSHSFLTRGNQNHELNTLLKSVITRYFCKLCFIFCLV